MFTFIQVSPHSNAALMAICSFAAVCWDISFYHLRGHFQSHKINSDLSYHAVLTHPPGMHVLILPPEYPVLSSDPPLFKCPSLVFNLFLLRILATRRVFLRTLVLNH